MARASDSGIPTFEERCNLHANGWSTEARFDDTGDDGIFNVPSAAGERQNAQRPSNVVGGPEEAATRRHFFRIAVDAMQDATEMSGNLHD